MDAYPSNLPRREKFLHYMIEIVVTIVFALVFCANLSLHFTNLNIGGFNIYWEFLLTMLIAGILGYVPSMIYILLIFAGQVVFNLQVAASIVMHLIIVISMYMIVRYRWFKSIRLTLVAFISMSVLNSLGNIIILGLCGIYIFDNLTIYDSALFFLGNLPQNIVAFLIIYYFLMKLGDDKKILFSVGRLYTLDYVENEDSILFDRTSDLRRRIVLYIIVELVLISLIVATIGSMMFTMIGDDKVANIFSMQLIDKEFTNTGNSLYMGNFIIRDRKSTRLNSSH